MERRILLTKSMNQMDGMKGWLIDARTIVTLAIMSMSIVVLVGVGSLVQHQVKESSVPSTNAGAKNISLTYLGGMMSEEIPYFNNPFSVSDFTLRSFTAAIIKSVTNWDVSDIGTNVIAELPNAKQYLSELYGAEFRTHDVINGQLMQDANLASLLDELNDINSIIDEKVINSDEKDKTNPIATSVSKQKQVAFVYHTHNRESWFPELGENSKDASSKNKNITLVGKRLAESLNKLNVGTVASDTDYPTEITDYRWEYSYKYSRKTVKEALASYKDVEMFFDIHRDSQPRKYTTVEINGKSYAQVYFIIGHKNPNWKKNDAFAKRINEKLEKEYPGLSRGILGKTAASGNAEYNQSLSDKNVLIEVGGVDNTLEESYRTADALASIIASIYEEDQQN